MITPKITRVQQSIDALSLRERLFVFAAVLIVIGGAWEAFLATPLEKRETIAADTISASKDRLEELNTSITVVAQGMSSGMPGSLERIRVLRQQVAAGEDSVRIFTTDLVDPAQMRFVLEDLIRRQSGLRLISVSNMDARPILENLDSEVDTDTEMTPMLYRHGLVLVLEGSYLNFLSYLDAAERLPWQLYWTRMQLETIDHPRSRIIVELHTLSLEEEWIGV